MDGKALIQAKKLDGATRCKILTVASCCQGKTRLRQPDSDSLTFIKGHGFDSGAGLSMTSFSVERFVVTNDALHPAAHLLTAGGASSTTTTLNRSEREKMIEW